MVSFRYFTSSFLRKSSLYSKGRVLTVQRHVAQRAFEEERSATRGAGFHFSS